MTDRQEAADYLCRVAVAIELLDSDGRLSAERLRAAAARLRDLDEPTWRGWLASGRTDLPDIEARLSGQLRAFASTGGVPEYDALQLRVPPGVFDLMKIPRVGLARARVLWNDAGIVTVSQLRRACRRGRVASLSGFGPRLEAQLLQEIERRHRAQSAWLARDALRVAAAREERLRATKGLVRLERAGELRRACELVHEIVWVAAGDEPGALLGRLASLPGARPSTVAMDSVDWITADEPRQRIVVVDRAHFAARWFLETGSREHGSATLRRLAGNDSFNGGWLPQSEADIYSRAGLAFVPPELREGRSEVATASTSELPALIVPADVRGVFHVHTNWSDGRLSITQVAALAAAQGWEYIGIADHSQSAFYANGLTAEKLAEQRREIHQTQPHFPRLRIFHGVESDILPDGSLDYPDDVLGQLDFVIVSVHSLLEMPAHAMTTRIARALSHPRATVLAHPSGRLLLEREPYAVDWETIFAAAANGRTAIEFSTAAERLDLDWRLIRAATRRGVKICINPDAHSEAALVRVAEGIATARKGWLTAEQVVNTRSAAEMEAYLHADEIR